MRTTFCLLLAASLVTGCSSDENSTKSDGSPTSSTGIGAGDEALSPYELFTAAVSDGAPTAQQALDWFVSLTGASLPDSEPTFGNVDGAVLLDGALEALVAHWDQYSDEQQSALIEFLRPLDAPATEGTEGATGAPSAGLTRAVRGVDPALQALVAPVNEEVGRLLGSSVDSSTIVLRPINADLVGTAHAETSGKPDLFGWRPAGDECTIVYGRAFARATIEQQRALLAHEIAHCHQIASASVAVLNGLPRWYFEGSAAWVGEVIGGGSGADLVGAFWRSFLAGNANLPTGDKGYSFLSDPFGYSAIGLFQWAAERQGRDAIARSILANLGKSTEEKLEFLFGTPGTAQRESLLSSFATAPVRRPFGASWQFSGIGLGSFGLGGLGRTMLDHPLDTTSALQLPLAEGGRIGVAAVSVTPTADVDLVHVATVGYGAITWNGEGETLSADGNIDQVFCVGEACRCAESLRDRTDVIAVSEGATAVIALAADTGMPIRIAAKGYHLADGSCDPCPAAGPSRPMHDSTAVLVENAAPPADPICNPSTTIAPVDASCLVGFWQVDNEVMARAFQAVTSVPGAPPGNQVVTGSFDLQLNADGTMALSVSEWTIASEQEGPIGTPPVLFESIFDGATSGTWTADELSLNIANSGTLGGRAFITIAGSRSEITGPQLPNLPVGNGTSNYLCSPDGVLVIRARAPGAVDLTLNRAG